MEEIRAKDLDELGLKVSKRAKESSREYELTILQSDILTEKEKRESIESEREYRKMLDEDIERHKQKLVERYGEVKV